MKFLIVGIILIIIVFAIIFNPQAVRLLKSVWLILQTKPYSQTGFGQGKIIIVGDSTAYGTGVYKAQDSIAGLIGNDFPAFSVETLAKNGRVISEVTSTLKTLNFSSQYDLLLLQIGGNDIIGNHLPETIEDDTRQMLIEAKKYAKHVVFLSSGNVGTAAYYVKNGKPDLELEKRTLRAREIFMQIAIEEGITYVDLFTPNEEDLFLLLPGKYLALDGLHPSAAGYNLWYQKLLPKINEALIKEY